MHNVMSSCSLFKVSLVMCFVQEPWQTDCAADTVSPADMAVWLAVELAYTCDILSLPSSHLLTLEAQAAVRLGPKHEALQSPGLVLPIRERTS